MNACMVTSVSDSTAWAALTTPNHAEWCHRHGHTHIARHLPYERAVADFAFLKALLDHFDAVWCLDSDAVVTNMAARLEGVPFRPGMHVCEEGLHPACPINCGSVIWFADDVSRWVLDQLRDAEHEWRRCTWIWQEWIARQRAVGIVWREAVTVHPPRMFNSCHHGTKCLWRPGDWVYHPCGMAHAERVARIREILGEVQR
jgi:hypothetical protein